MMKMNELVVWFQKEYPEMVTDMMASNHHYENMDKLTQGSGVVEGSLRTPVDINPYHQEGDVWTHTMMVCKQAENMPYEVQIAALLHDIGKPDTREVNPKNNHVMFLNHDAVSAFRTLEILNRPELELSKEQKVLIFNMIALHTQVFKQTPNQLMSTCMNQPELQKNVLLLGKADHEGRFTNKTGDVIQPDSLDYLSGANSGYTKEVIILCGLPGSGKSTWMRKNINIIKETDLISRDGIIETSLPDMNYNEAFKAIDQNWVDNELKRQFQNSAKYRNRVIVDMTHMSKKSRRKSLSYYGPEYKRKCIVFLTDLPTVFLRNKERNGKTIPKKVINDMMTRFYPPTYEEFDEIEYIC